MHGATTGERLGKSRIIREGETAEHPALKFVSDALRLPPLTALIVAPDAINIY